MYVASQPFDRGERRQKAEQPFDFGTAKSGRLEPTGQGICDETGPSRYVSRGL